MELKNVELLKESLTSSLPRSLTSDIIIKYREILPENGWIILGQFATLKMTSGESLAISVNDLDRIFRGKLHINTIRNMIKKLIYKSFIRIHREDRGKTRTEKVYLVTMNGKIMWANYFKEVVEIL